MTSEEFHQGIVRTCRESQKLMDSSVESADLNLPTLVGDSAKHLELWREHDTRLSEPAQLEGADFRGLVFRNHRFRNQSFVNCDFSRSRWLLAGIQDGDCSGSNFSGITTMFFDLQNMDCTGCNFSNATLWFGDVYKRQAPSRAADCGWRGFDRNARVAL